MTQKRSIVIVFPFPKKSVKFIPRASLKIMAITFLAHATVSASFGTRSPDWVHSYDCSFLSADTWGSHFSLSSKEQCTGFVWKKLLFVLQRVSRTYFVRSLQSSHPTYWQLSWLHIVIKILSTRSRKMSTASDISNIFIVLQLSLIHI